MIAIRDSEQRSDADIIVASLGTPAAFGAVFDRHFGVVHRFLAARAGRDLADDLAAQTFVIALQRRSSFHASSTSSALPWLLGIATNLLRTARRSERRHLAALARLGSDESVLGEPEGRDPKVRARVARALADLHPHQRDALLLHVCAELTIAEVAASLGIPEGTASSRISRARRRLRAALGDASVATNAVPHQPESSSKGSTNE